MTFSGKEYFKMARVTKISIVVCLFALISGSGSGKQLNPVIQTEFGSPSEIDGEEIFQEVFGKVSFRLIDDRIIFSTRDEDMFQVYDLNGNPVSSFGRQGRGPGEYEEPPFFRDTFFSENDREYLLFYDGSNNMTGVMLDLTASIRENDVVIKKEIPLPEVFSHTFVSLYRIDKENYLGLSEDRFYQQHDGLEGGWYYSPADTSLNTFSMFNLFMEPFDAIPESNLNNRNLTVSPDRQQFAAAFFHAPIIEIFDMYSTDVRLQIQVTDEPFPPAEPFTPDDFYEYRFINYFRDIYATNEHIYVLYSGKEILEIIESDTEQFIKVMDWDGNPVQQYSIPPGYEIEVIQVDESTNQLYGLSWDNDAIYRFDL